MAATPKPQLASSYPYEPNPKAAVLLLSAGLLIIIGTGLATTLGVKIAYTGGDAAASAGILFALALMLQAPTLIMDATESEGGQPSTMRAVTLAIIFTFCALMLKTGWDKQALPSLENQGNWVWLVTAALGGKALQKYAEVKGKQETK